MVQRLKKLKYNIMLSLKFKFRCIERNFQKIIRFREILNVYIYLATRHAVLGMIEGLMIRHLYNFILIS